MTKFQRSEGITDFFMHGKKKNNFLNTETMRRGIKMDKVKNNFIFSLSTRSHMLRQRALKSILSQRSMVIHLVLGPRKLQDLPPVWSV